jgi:hypothetical protein
VRDNVCFTISLACLAQNYLLPLLLALFYADFSFFTFLSFIKSPFLVCNVCLGVRQEHLLSDCLNKTMKSVGEGTKTRVNINIFLSQDLADDGFSDNDGPSHAETHAVSSKLFYQFRFTCMK